MLLPELYLLSSAQSCALRTHLASFGRVFPREKRHRGLLNVPGYIQGMTKDGNQITLGAACVVGVAGAAAGLIALWRHLKEREKWPPIAKFSNREVAEFWLEGMSWKRIYEASKEAEAQGGRGPQNQKTKPKPIKCKSCSMFFTSLTITIQSCVSIYKKLLILYQQNPF